MVTAEELFPTSRNTNVAQAERWASVVAGSALAAFGVTRRSRAGLALAALGSTLIFRGATGHCPAYQALGISTADGQPQERQVSVPYGRGVRVEKSITINTTPEQMYAFWRDFSNLPRFMRHLKSVEVRDAKRSRWIAKGPAGIDAEWDAEIINEVPNELIGWRSVANSNVDNAGSVHFERNTGGRGTVVRVVLRYDPPAGKAGTAVATLFGKNPSHEVQEDLRTLKQIIETGEIATTEGSPSARES